MIPLGITVLKTLLIGAKYGAHELAHLCGLLDLQHRRRSRTATPQPHTGLNTLVVVEWSHPHLASMLFEAPNTLGRLSPAIKPKLPGCPEQQQQPDYQLTRTGKD